LYRFGFIIAYFLKVKEVRDNLSPVCWDVLWPTCTPNLKSLA